MAVHYDPEFVPTVVEELRQLAKLEKNWDQYGAPPINPEVIRAAEQFVKILPPNLVFRPRIVPLSSGNLQFEWREGEKLLEFEFESPTTVHYLLWDPPSKVEDEGTFRVSNVKAAVENIRWFTSGILTS